MIMLRLGGSDGKGYYGGLRMPDVLFPHETSEAEKGKILQSDYDWVYQDFLKK